jgi:hypothetical protein
MRLRNCWSELHDHLNTIKAMQYAPATAFNILAKQPKLTCGCSKFLTKIEV